MKRNLAVSQILLVFISILESLDIFLFYKYHNVPYGFLSFVEVTSNFTFAVEYNPNLELFGCFSGNSKKQKKRNVAVAVLWCF
jgi:hypothetical protein